jgi:peptide deformylase
MILPITVYGNPVLRKKAVPVGPDYPELKELIDNMFETMYLAEGVGLAAPQINRSIRLIVLDTSSFGEDDPGAAGFKKVVINPEIIDFPTDEEIEFNEGCLSLPGIRENVWRPDKVRLSYFDAEFNRHEEIWEGVPARVLQHEFDHLEGKVFVDLISPLRRRLLGSKLTAMVKGKASANYRIINNK